jgi:protein O-mannosyl-transferase
MSFPLKHWNSPGQPLRLASYAAIIILIAVAYGGSLHNGFVWDDETFIVNNKYVHDISRWKEYFTVPESISTAPLASSMYRPIQTLSYALDAFLWGENPAGYHFTSLLLHFACCVAIVFAFGSIVGLNAAFASAMIFAIHPALSEGVLDLSARGNQLYALFSLVSFGCFVRTNAPFDRNHILSVVTLLLSLFSKEQAIALIALLPAVQVALGKPWQFKNFRSIFLYIPLVLAVLLFLVVRSHVVGALSVAPYWGGTLWATVQMQAKVFIIYLTLLLYPFHLQGRYDIAVPASFPDFFVIGAFAINIVFIAGSVFLYHRGNRRKFIALAAAWFYLSLAPVSNLIPIPGSMMGERFIYFTFAGMLPFLAAVIEPSLTRKHVMLYASCGVVLSLAWLATDFSRTLVWRDNRSFFTLAAQQTPTSMAVQIRMVQEEIASKDLETALRRTEGVLRERSHDPIDAVTIDFHFWRGKVLLEADRPAEAYKEFRIYTDFHGEISKELALLLAEAAARSGDMKSALLLLKEESGKSASDDSIWNGLGNVYLMMNEFSSAADCYKRALSINPGNKEAAANFQFALNKMLKK